MRQIVLDTETTGLEPEQGHRIIEIGGVEVIDRRLTGRHFHQYINPQRAIDAGALEVHGITPQFLRDKPVFADIVEDLLQFITGAELVIHNAPFDVAFLDHELRRWKAASQPVAAQCKILDTLMMARKMHPGQRNSLAALCKRYFVDDSQRDLHGALLDAEILADVYLAMTGGQTALALGDEDDSPDNQREERYRQVERRGDVRVLRASDAELKAHEARLDALDASSGGSIWRTRGQ